MNEILESYVEDLRDSLILFDEALMDLNQGNEDAETVNRVFRVAHTIKGNSAAMEFFKVEKVMHMMEDILHEVRENTRELTPQITKIMYKCHDFLEDFLNVVVRDENDEKLEPEELLSELLTIKNGSAGEDAEEKAPADEPGIGFSDEAFSNMDSEILGVIEKNISMGMSAYQLIIKFRDDAEMKSIRAFMIFQKIESNAFIAYSNPVVPTEEEFRSGEFECKSDTLKMLIIADSDVEDLADEIREDYNIENVEYTQLTRSQIKKKLESSGAIEKIIEMIDEIEVDVLDVEKSEINSETVESILEKLTVIHERADILDNEALNGISARLTNILKTTSMGKRSFPPDDVQVVAYVLRDMANVAQAKNTAEGEVILKQIEKNMAVLEENLLKKEVRTGEILRAKGILSLEDIEHIISKQKEGPKKLKFGQVAVKEKKVSAVEMSEVLKEQKRPSKELVETSAEASRQIRVSVGKVDNLIDMLGELTILNSQLEQQLQAHLSSLPEISNTISRTSKIVRNVQDLSMSLRLIQIKNTLFRLTRIIRDTASELGKKVNISITGDEIEIDRSAAERVFDPLMHLVRNAVSHGIESPEERKKLGKPAEGKVEINAYSKRGSVYIEVKDDGKGMDPQKVLEKAIQLGLADEKTDYSEADILGFIMKPGFSTQTEVNNISGRGVGMNVVESELMKIGGKVEIENELGKGCTFILRIPMNLALINGTIVDLSGERYIIPTLFIKQFYIKEEKDWISMQGHKRAVKIRENIIPVISEEAIFKNIKKDSKEKNQLIILEMEKNLLGLPVDNIIGRQEIVSKPLNTELSKSRVFAGASILGDGKVSLILDIEAIYKQAGY